MPGCAAARIATRGPGRQQNDGDQGIDQACGDHPFGLTDTDPATCSTATAGA